MNDVPEWVPLTEGVRIIARAASGAPGDAIAHEILVQAVGVLERAGREGKVRTEGLRFLETDASPVAAEDWMRLQIYVGDELDDPHHNPRVRRVRITKVLVDARDVRLLLEDLVEAKPSDLTASSASLSSSASHNAQNKRRSGPRDRVLEALAIKHPNGVPPVSKLTHKQLVSDVKDILKDQTPETTTILRAAGRRSYPRRGSNKGIKLLPKLP